MTQWFDFTLEGDAKEPSYGSEYAAGIDLYSTETITVKPHSIHIFSTGVRASIPHGNFGSIRDRSSMAKKGWAVKGGVVDSDYRGVIGVMLQNTTNDILSIEKGDKIAQMIIQPYSIPILRQVDKLIETKRGEGGFGSSGK